MTGSTTSERSVELIRPRDLWRLIWSPEGWRCIVCIRLGVAHQTFHKTDEEAETYALQMDAAEGVDVYYACGTTQEPGSRKRENIWHLKAYWLDIDCGPGKPYSDR